MGEKGHFEGMFETLRSGTYEGAVSATITVNLRFRAAFLRKASTVFECPIVRMNSLFRDWSSVIIAKTQRATCSLTQNGYDLLTVLLHFDKSSPPHPSTPE